MLQQQLFFQPLHEPTLRLRTNNRLCILYVVLQKRTSAAEVGLNNTYQSSRTGARWQQLLRCQEITPTKKSISVALTLTFHKRRLLVVVQPPSEIYRGMRRSERHIFRPIPMSVSSPRHDRRQLWRALGHSSVLQHAVDKRSLEAAKIVAINTNRKKDSTRVQPQIAHPCGDA
jgi:hypothetical protein